MGKSRAAAARQKQKRAAKQKQRRAKTAAAKAKHAASPPKAARQGDWADTPLPEAVVNRIGYDANRSPPPPYWLSLEEPERVAAVQRYHDHALPEARRPPAPVRHATLHVLIENQVASANPPEATAALIRLVREGMSRHNALHALCFVCSKHMSATVQSREAFDPAAYVADLSTLTETRYRAMLREAAGA